jgi:hypothetical protein
MNAAAMNAALHATGRGRHPTLHATTAVAHLAPPPNPGTPNPSVGFNGF